MFVGTGTLGAILAAVSLLAGYSEEARNAVLIPVNFLPAIAFLVWMRSKGGVPLSKIQNVAAGLWIVPGGAGAAYIARFSPDEVLIGVLSTTVINGVLWLILFQITRKLYRAKRQRNYAIASGRPFDDPEIRQLSDNSDLSTAVVLATFAAANCVIIMDKVIGGHFYESAIVVTSMNIGCTLGFMWFNFCPNQTRIRELAS